MNTEQIPLVSNKRALLDTEVAARLGIAPFSVRAWRHKGQAPRFTKMGRAVSYRPEVRVVLAGGMLHLTSCTEPWVSPATPTQVDADWLADPDYGDTTGLSIGTTRSPSSGGSGRTARRVRIASKIQMARVLAEAQDEQHDAPATGIDRRTRVADLPEFLSPQGFGRYLGLSRSLVYELLRRGEIPHRRFGRCIRIPRSAITPVK